MRLHRVLSIVGVAALIGTAGVIAAPAASADQIWHQAVAVSSPAVPCPVTTPDEKAAGWSEWAHSWEYWPNEGRGGNVCERAITWAYESNESSESQPSAVCLLVFTQQHFSFANGQIVSAGAPGYYSPDCTGQTRGVTAAPLVYAPGGTNADALCWQAQPGSVAFVILSLTPDVFICYLP